MAANTGVCSRLFQSILTSPDLDRVVIEQTNSVVNALKSKNGSVNPDDYLYSANVNIVRYILFGRTLEFDGTEYHTLTKEMDEALATLAASPIQRYVVNFLRSLLLPVSAEA